MKLQKAGVDQIRDIYDIIEHRFKTFEELQFEYGVKIGTYLEYYSIVACLPDNWYNLLREVNRVEVEPENSNLEKTCTIPKVAKYVYTQLLQDHAKNNCDGARLVWMAQLDMIIEEDKWEKLCSMGHHISIATKLRYFQFRLLSNKLVTKWHRSKWDTTIVGTCTFCQEYDKTVMHILWKCDKV